MGRVEYIVGKGGKCLLQAFSPIPTKSGLRNHRNTTETPKYPYFLAI